jgi:hypothetical protein
MRKIITELILKLVKNVKHELSVFWKKFKLFAPCSLSFLEAWPFWYCLFLFLRIVAVILIIILICGIIYMIFFFFVPDDTILRYKEEWEIFCLQAERFFRIAIYVLAKKVPKALEKMYALLERTALKDYNNLREKGFLMFLRDFCLAVEKLIYEDLLFYVSAKIALYLDRKDIKIDFEKFYKLMRFLGLGFELFIFILKIVCKILLFIIEYIISR